MLYLNQKCVGHCKGKLSARMGHKTIGSRQYAGQPVANGTIMCIHSAGLWAMNNRSKGGMDFLL